MKVFVTGGAGFLGINLVRHLLANGAEAVASYDIADFDYPEKGEAWLKFTLGDVRDAAMVDRLTEGCDVVVNTAAALPLYSPEDIRTTEVDGIRNVLASAKRFAVKETFALFPFDVAETDAIAAHVLAKSDFQSI